MPHQCVRCSKIYDDGATEVLKGCPCGGRFFFFMSKQAVDKVKIISAGLTKEDRLNIENDIKDIIEVEDDETPVYLDIETIRILKPGKYELDLVELFQGNPLVYKYGSGRYIIDLASTFKSVKDEKEEKK
ncbi:hypothetical protein J4438_03805 [Candidatus Woesearchaeota archaeon]|nr:hypothetical protein [Candidatus Woesearchaeota archaeon]